MDRKLLGSLVLLSLAACGKKAPIVSADFVDTGKVETILVAQNERDRNNCTAELRATGAKVLFQGTSGLILTDRKSGDLALGTCAATIAPNSPLILDTRVKARGLGQGQAANLPTLLKLIPAETIGARTFVKDNPTYDGRGVTVAVLDTGVEIDHPMLKKTSTGDDKIVAVADFSGQGRVELKDAAVAGGAITVDGTSYKVGSLTAVKFGVFKGSTLVYSEAVSAADDFKDVGVITFQAADGSQHAKIDTNDDKDFGDEVELYDFDKSHLFTKLGKKRLLTVSVNVAADGAVASLVFDDGSHGTHVAGMSTGYDPKGLVGVAPGAKVISAKIGDNRLSGGSTTTASMLLAIDYAVSKGAQVINMSYGIRSGSNVGKSAIDQYVDKVAREKGTLFSISAGNEGPGLLTVGTPAGAELAISNAAYLPLVSAQSNYGYNAIKKDTLWYFSSVGPQLDGGWKPTLLAPGTALSSVPGWTEGLATYSGTSMASPMVTGGLALLLSAAKQAQLPEDRATITRAVYLSAKKIPDLAIIEQGHGLLNVPASLESLKGLKGLLPIEYTLSVNSPTAPGGKGKGIYVRARRLPGNEFSVGVTPLFPASATSADKTALKTYKLVPSAPFIHAPPDFYLLSVGRAFRVSLDKEVMLQPGLHSEKISAIEESTGLVAFEVPVTVAVPGLLSDSNEHTLEADLTVDVGTTQRLFVDVPAGTTALQLDLISDGPSVWAQLLDSEGRLALKLQDPDRNAPQSPLLGQANTERAGVYEIDIVAPPFIQRPVGVKMRIKGYSLRLRKGPNTSKTAFEVHVDNDFDAIKVQAKVDLAAHAKSKIVAVSGQSVDIPFSVSSKDAGEYTNIDFRAVTSKATYDQMTDYPYLVFDPDKNLVTSGGFELDSHVTLSGLDKLAQGDYTLRVTGAFTDTSVTDWVFGLTEERPLKKPVSLHSGNLQLLEAGQEIVIPVDLARAKAAPAGYENCASVKLLGAAGRLIQSGSFCP